MARAIVAGTGVYAPGDPIGNEELMRLAGVEFDAARLESKLGIRTRHLARLRGIDETSADFAEKASLAALADAGVGASEVGLFIVATDTPEYVTPATSILLQGRLVGRESEAEAYDVGASCASFVTALDSAARSLMTDPSLRYALVVGVYCMSAHIRPGDAFGWSIFADGAGAVLLARAGENAEIDAGTDTVTGAAPGYVDGVFATDGTQWDYIGVYAGGTRRPCSPALAQSGAWGLELLKPLPGDRNVKLWPPLVGRLLGKTARAAGDIDHFLFTQINRSVIEQVMGILGRGMDATTCVMDRYGYTGSACIPMALHAALGEGRAGKGDSLVMVASGAGFAVGANLLIL